MLRRKLLATSIERLLPYKIICKNWTTGQGGHGQTELMPTKVNLFTFSSFPIQAIYEIFKSASLASLWTWSDHTGPHWTILDHTGNTWQELSSSWILWRQQTHYLAQFSYLTSLGFGGCDLDTRRMGAEKGTVHRYISIKEWHWPSVAARGCKSLHSGG